MAIQPLVELGADVNACSVDGFTPLYVAVAADRQDVVFELIRSGARVTNELLFKAQSAPVVAELIRNKADLTIKDKDSGKTPIELANDLGKNQGLIRALSGCYSAPVHVPIVRSKSLGASGVVTPVVVEAENTSRLSTNESMSPVDIVSQLESIHQYVSEHIDELAQIDLLWIRKCSYITKALTASFVEIEKASHARAEPPSLCTICKTEPKSVVLMPCRHFCVCGTCAKALENGGTWESPSVHQPDAEPSRPCPICRSNIQEFVSVYT
jgi:hypothetical protein